MIWQKIIIHQFQQKDISVVDYLCVPHDHLKYWNNFSVLPVSDIIHENDIEVIQSTTMPDHSVVCATIIPSDFESLGKLQTVTEKSEENSLIPSKVFRKYQVDELPGTLFNSLDFGLF